MDYVDKEGGNKEFNAQAKNDVELIMVSQREVKQVFLAQLVLRECGLRRWPLGSPLLLLALFFQCSCSACIVARICNCCAMNSDVFGLGGRGASVDTGRKTRGSSRENVPHPENAHGSPHHRLLSPLSFLS
jgi:hypothetical protein